MVLGSIPIEFFRILLDYDIDSIAGRGKMNDAT
jgi:hypothetical protein